MSHDSHKSNSEGTIVIPSTIEAISRDHLDRFKDAEKIVFEQGLTLSNIHSMAFTTFNVMEITIPKSITVIGHKCFYRCQQLSKVLFEIGSKLEVIESCCFYCCLELKEIDFKRTKLRMLGDDAFIRTAIEKIVIPSSVEFLGYRCFGSCRKLKCVSFENHSRLSFLQSGTFAGCKSLIKVKLGILLEAFFESTLKKGRR